MVYAGRMKMDPHKTRPRAAASIAPALRVGEVARLAHVSVRTLHHYDDIGLLAPSGRTAAGYRLYSEADLRRLRQVLFYRQLDFGLDEIAAMLADAGAG